MEETIGIREDSNLAKSREAYNSGGYYLNISREINDKYFFNEFLKYFGDVDSLSITAYGDGVLYDFLYQMPNLETLNLRTMYEIDFIHLKKLNTLSIMWNKKMINNFDKLNNLEYLSITDFDEKDLTKLSSLTKLKSLNITRSKIKSLKGIETLTNLEYLLLAAVRSLTDISDITTLKKLNRIDFDICWKLQDFSPIGELKEIEILELQDCKSLASIKFVSQLPKLKRLIALGTTIINDFDTTPAKNVPIFWGSQRPEYNKHYLEKEIK